MFDIKKIVFPVDFSARSEGASHYVDVLAEKFNPEIDMVHVLPYPHYEAISLEISGPALSEVMESREVSAKSQVKGFLAEKFAKYKVNRLVVDGDPAEEIVKHATKSGADLIVMPTHGYGRFRRFILGSVTSKVLHDAKSPVLTGVHMEQTPESVNIRRVLVAIDLGKQSDAVLDWGVGIAKKFDAKLIVTHIVEGVKGGFESLTDSVAAEAYTNPIRQQIQALLAQKGADASIVVSFGVPSKQICEVAEAEKVDLTVIGRGGGESVLGRLRTQSYAVIRMSPCPVVSV